MSSETEHIDLLKKLLLEDDFMSIQGLAKQEVNLMSILKVAHKELQHSNLLAWLFNPNETHGLGDYFLKEFIKLYFRENNYQDLVSGESKLSVFEFVEFNFDDLVILRERGNIDILVLSKSNELCIVIENKIYASEGKGQLRKYRKYIEENYPNYTYKLFIYLSLFEQEITEKEKEYYIRITYNHVKSIISKLINDQNISIAKNTNFILNQYLQTLLTLMKENDEIEKLAKKIYNKYKPAFDIVYKYAKPDPNSFIKNCLIELIDDNQNIKAFKSNNRYVRFQPNVLHKNIEVLRKANLIDKTDDLSENWMFIFEFNITKNKISFDIKVGDHANKEYRLNLFKLYCSDLTLFNKVNSKGGSLSPKYHQALNKRIMPLDSEDFSTLGEDEIELFKNELKINFDKLMEKEMKKYEEFMNDFFRSKSLLQNPK